KYPRAHERQHREQGHDHLCSLAEEQRRNAGGPHRPKQKGPDVQAADEQRSRVARTPHSAHRSPKSISAACPGEIEERVHAVGVPSLVSARNTSSSDCPASSGCAFIKSSIEPYATQRPWRSTINFVQSSSTRLSRCELRITAAPAEARATIVSRIRRMPPGSRPVSGSSRIS